MIPCKFFNVRQIILFSNTNKVKIKNKKYTNNYSKNEEQRIYRIKTIIKAILQQSRMTNVVNTTEHFEKYYRGNNNSMRSLVENTWSNFN